MKKKQSPVTPDGWSELKQFTDARISLGRCGSSLPLSEALSFRLAHARARDAVWSPFNAEGLSADIEALGCRCLRLASSVTDRSEYLTRPDKGRRLGEESRALLEKESTGYDLCLVVSDGLSSRAINENAVPFLERFLPLTRAAGLTVAPVCLVENGRVAIADEVASILEAKLTAILIGERPGLSSPNSMGIYMTYAPRQGATDEARNCISNVRQGGMTIEAGVQKLAYLMETAFRMQTSGVALKDKMSPDYLPFGGLDAALGR
ncbi:ethanolamine ammonia-lyase [Oceanidesulfovibrio indonesiensis]|uniref:Ethanolamine ammonia-lyase small subunit n=2 Tax=Oceanidesulfovibrio indonesiensis TaxID=54767 RepID=A0A7M3MIM1_9BACT|nr:ethanolamine ammonia-lyase [Oceanidesulfovibrio indonesiensis]